MGIYDIGIIGGGTAGMTAAIYGQRAGKQTILFEGTTFGGQITSSPNVENYPGIASVSGSEFSMNLMDQAVKLGAQTIMEQVTGIREEADYKVIVTTEKELEQLVEAATHISGYIQKTSGNYIRTVNAGKIIGFDVTTNSTTTIYTVVTNSKTNELISIFPGLPK